MPGFDEARWIVLEDINVEYLLDVFTSTSQTSDNVWDACSHFVEHLVWYKPRPTLLGSKIEALADDHPSKPNCLFPLSWVFQTLGNHVERKRLLTHLLELQRQQGDDSQVAKTLRNLCDVNRFFDLHEEGIRQGKEALAIFEQIGDTRGQARCLQDLSRSFFSNNQLVPAEEAASRAINLISDEGQEYTVCGLHRTLGMIHRSKGEKEKAIFHCKTALGIASPQNWHDELFWNHYNLANLFHDKDEFSDANSHIEQAKSFVVHDTYKLGRVMEVQADIWYREGRLDEAKLEVFHALEAYEEVGALGDVEDCRDLLQKVEQAMATRSAGIQR